MDDPTPAYTREGKSVTEDQNPRPDGQPPASPPVKANNGDSSAYPNLRPWKPGQSGNPLGRPKIEPRVRRYARKFDRRMCTVLASIAEDKTAPWSERRRAAMDLIAIGSGRPATTQELVGRPDAPLGPLVNINMGNPAHQAMSPEAAWSFICGHPNAPSEEIAAAEAVINAAATRSRALAAPEMPVVEEAPQLEVADNVVPIRGEP
jgi:hypothetical protein